ncbi:SecDF P1 head subdomain-containing protein [Aquimarina mytili]|uniref:SecDF P1 head subdomain domain-containing protein n=1 Tax=Aquimarina mytili TaxID=874423 RepID=A0A937DBC5_9FLAO|nr:hypothetical protein [Aquimarina mytili]MBL0685602.1 hypothetical protein [Aquimarina mytili]
MIFYKAFGISILLLFVVSSASGQQTYKKLNVTLQFDAKHNVDNKAYTEKIIQTLSRRLQGVSKKTQFYNGTKNNEVSIELITKSDPERIKSLLLHNGELKFYEAFYRRDLIKFVGELRKLLKKEKLIGKSPLFDLDDKMTIKNDERAVILYISEKDTSTVNKYLSNQNLHSLLPINKEDVSFFWSKKEEDPEDELFLYAVKLEKGGKPILEGDIIEKAYYEPNIFGRFSVIVKFNDEGTEKWKELTEKAFVKHFKIAIVGNDMVYADPGIVSGAISTGVFEITTFSLYEAQDFTYILNSGSLPDLRLTNFEEEELK